MPRRINWADVEAHLLIQAKLRNNPELKTSIDGWIMDNMPFEAEIKASQGLVAELTYRVGRDYVTFKPKGVKQSLTSASKDSLVFQNAFVEGVHLELKLNSRHWRKIITIESIDHLDLSGRFVDFVFDVETTFDIPKYQNDKPRIKLGDSYLEVSKAKDSLYIPPNKEAEIPDAIENEIKVESFFRNVDGQLQFVKRIPTRWLKEAKLPVWTDADITYGSASEFEDGAVLFVKCCEIDTNKFVVVYEDVSDGEAGKARVGTVSGTTITWGDISEFCSDVGIGLHLGVCKLNTDKFVVVYADDANADDGYARVGTVATRTISWGTAKEFETGDCEYPSCCQLGTDKFAIFYNDEAVGDDATVCICTVSGTTITSGTPVVFTLDRPNFYSTSCCKLDTDKFAVVFVDTYDGTYWYSVKACAFTVAGTVPTAGDILDIDIAGECSQSTICQLDTNKFVISWCNDTDHEQYVAVCTVSGTTITLGTPQLIATPAGGERAGLVAVDTSSFIIVYNEQGDTEGKSRLCTVSGTTITLGDEETFNAADTDWSDICLIDSTHVAIVYRDEADAGDIGEAIIGAMEAVGPTIVEGSAAGSGIGLATSTAKLDVLAQALGNGIGLSQSSSYLIISGLAGGEGIGLASATGQIVGIIVEGTGAGSGVGTATAQGFLVVIGQAQGSGVGEATVQAILDILAEADGSGIGLGSTEALIRVLAAAAASGEGLGSAEALLEVLAEALGSGEGLGVVIIEIAIFSSESGIGIERASRAGWLMKPVVYTKNAFEQKVYTGE